MLKEFAVFYTLFWQVFSIVTHWMLDPWMKWWNGSDMLVKVFIFFFLLMSCYLLVFLSSLSALMQACRHLIPMFFFSLYPPYPSFVYTPLSLGRHTHFLTRACRNQTSSTTPIFLSFILHPTPPLTWNLKGACYPSLFRIPVKTTHLSLHIHTIHQARFSL